MVLALAQFSTLRNRAGRPRLSLLGRFARIPLELHQPSVAGFIENRPVRKASTDPLCERATPETKSARLRGRPRTWHEARFRLSGFQPGLFELLQRIKPPRLDSRYRTAVAGHGKGVCSDLVGV